MLKVGTGLLVAAAAIGWLAGFRDAAGYLLLGTSCAFVAVTAVALGRRLFGWAGWADDLIRSAVIAFALIVLSGFVLGWAGLISPFPYLVLLGGSAVWALRLRPAGVVPRPLDARWLPWPVVAIAAALLAFVVGHGLVHSPMTAYDSLSYHLVFPARWLQDHRLSIIPTPFSDEAQAYAPANGELFFLWLMLPLHGDVFARVGQIPFYLLGAVTMYALARRMGARASHACYPAAFYLVARPVIEQAVGADVDLICWGMFLTSLYLGIRAVDTDERRDWAIFGVSLGLCVGSKYAALVYLPIFAILVMARGPRARALWALPGVAALALPWYLRNWFAGGSPIYPASLMVAGVTLAQGAYSRAAMLNSEFHTTDVRLFPVIAARAFGPALLALWLPCAALGVWRLVRRRLWWPGAFLAVTPLVMVPLFWLGVPDNIDPRFLLPAVVVALLPLAFVFGRDGRWNAAVHVVYTAGLVWVLVGLDRQVNLPVPWYMRGWLTFGGAVGSTHLILFLAFAGAAAALWRVAGGSRYLTASMVAAVGAGAVALTVGADVWCRPVRCEFLETTPIYLRSDFGSAWEWVDRNVAHATIANTGNNLPYPLFGDHLDNRVFYVNIDHHPTWRFHDYDRAVRRRSEGTPASTPLARSSGVLRPVDGYRDGHVDAVRPRYERMRGYREAWIQNLKALGVDHLFVSTLSAYELDYQWHDALEFPVEDEWARADPRAFKLAYANGQVRIYDVDLR